MCKRREALSKDVLIGRGLDPILRNGTLFAKQFDIQF